MADRSEERESQVDRLYGLPLEEFTRARDELARGLRRDGQGEAAAQVKRLGKPSVAAWAINQVRRAEPGRVEELLDAGARLREAQERLLGGGDREPLDRASADERRLVAELVRHAERALAESGRPVGAAVVEKMRGTLHAAASDPDAREGLRSGRLVREHTATGLGPVPETPGGTRAVTPRGRRKPSGAEAAQAREARRLEERLDRARAKHDELEEALSVTRRELRKLRRDAERAAARLERAEAAEGQATSRTRQAGERVAQLEAALRELEAGRGRSAGAGRRR